MIRKLLTAAVVAAVFGSSSIEAKTVVLNFESATLDLTDKTTPSNTLKAAGGHDDRSVVLSESNAEALLEFSIWLMVLVGFTALGFRRASRRRPIVPA